MRRVSLVLEREAALRFTFSIDGLTLEAIGSEQAQASETHRRAPHRRRHRGVAEAAVPARRPRRGALGIRAHLVHQDREPQQAGSGAITSQSSKDQAGADNYKYLLQPNLLAALSIRPKHGRTLPCTSASSASAKWATTCVPASAKHGIEVTGYDPQSRRSSDVAILADLVAALPAPRIVWVMVPSGAITDARRSPNSASVLETGDLVIEGGNSRSPRTSSTPQLLAREGHRLHRLPVSPAVSGVIENGYGLMVGGAKPSRSSARMPVFDALRPEGPRDEGFVHAGEIGAGHYAKMVHNGIEYALMQA